MSSSTLERAFLTRWEQFTRDLDPKPKDPIAQSYFHLERDWRYDYAWPESLVCLDLQGGGWNRGAHHRELGTVNDYQKHNAALLMGWKPFLASTSMIENDPASVIENILTALKQPVPLTIDTELSIWTSLIRNLVKVGDQVEYAYIKIKRAKRNVFLVDIFENQYQTTPEKYLLDAHKQVLELIFPKGTK